MTTKVFSIEFEVHGLNHVINGTVEGTAVTVEEVGVESRRTKTDRYVSWYNEFTKDAFVAEFSDKIEPLARKAAKLPAPRCTVGSHG